MTAPIRARFLCLAIIAIGCSGALAQIDRAPPFPMDTPQTMRNFEAVCTGIGSEARTDPRWAAYPLRVEVTGRAGIYLGAAQVTLNKDGDALVSVNCSGPWVLFRVPPGAYEVTAETSGLVKNGRVNVGGRSQARLIIRFPEIAGGAVPQNAPP